MDEEFGVDNLIREEKTKQKQKVLTSLSFKSLVRTLGFFF